MGIPLDSVSSAVKVLDAVRGDVAAPIRVAVFVDSTATPYLIETVREALVPQTTSGLVRVERLGETRATVKDDTDVVLVLSCGSERLQARVQELVVCGAPVAVVAESSVEVPFIEHDTPMLGLVAATDAVHLLSSLARWILDRTDKDTAPTSRSCASPRRVTWWGRPRWATWPAGRCSSSPAPISRS